MNTPMHAHRPTCLPAFLPTYVPTCMLTHIHTHVHTYMHTWIPTYIITYTPHTYRHTRVNTDVHTNTYIYKYMHTYIHIRTHTHAWRRKEGLDRSDESAFMPRHIHSNPATDNATCNNGLPREVGEHHSLNRLARQSRKR